MSIGTQLRRAREEQALSLDEVAQATHIRVYYLEALETDQFDLLPSRAQLHGFLRAYSNFLKLNSAELIASLSEDLPVSSDLSTIHQPAAEPGPSSSNSADIFKQLGHLLRSQRELMGLSVGDVERHTHIRMHYVQALEEGDISHLPSPVQGRGMLSNYASFLGLDTETVLLRFADGLQASLYDRQAAKKISSTSPRNREATQAPARPSQLKRLFSMDLFVGGFLIIFLLGFTIWGAYRVSKLHTGQEASPTAPPVSEILISSPTAGVSAKLTPAPSSETTPFAAASAVPLMITGTVQSELNPTPMIIEPTAGLSTAPIQVSIVAIQPAWMRVIVDGKVAFEGRVVLGSAYSFAGNERIEFLTGDGAGLQVYFNQQDLGILGSFGEVVERIFSIAGVQTPTPAVPPTRTPVPTTSLTPSPTTTNTGVPKTPTPTPKP